MFWGLPDILTIANIGADCWTQRWAEGAGELGGPVGHVGGADLEARFCGVSAAGFIYIYICTKK